MATNPHARLTAQEQAREAQAFLAWLAHTDTGSWEQAFEAWAIHLLPGDWHRVRRLVEASVYTRREKAA